MTEHQLVGFIERQEIEIDWRGDKLMIWIHAYDLSEFAEIVGDEYLSDGGYPADIMSNGYICLEINDLCEAFEIDPQRVLPREDVTV